MLTGAWRRLPWPARLAAGAALAAAALGLYASLGSLVGTVRQAAQPELAARIATWGPAYGFGVACAPALQPGAGVLLVDPADALQPPYPGAPRDADWNDQDRFAYAVSPRRVTVAGRLAPDWDPATAGQGYVAVWQQVAWRSDEARAAAASTAAALDASPVASVACRYSDAGGDRGTVYAIAPTPVAAGPPSELRPPTAWSDYPPALLGLACLWAIGFALLRLVAGPRPGAGLACALAFPLGAAAASVQLLTYSLAGAGWSALTVAPPWLLLAGAAAWRDRAGLAALAADPPRPAAAWRSLSGDHRLALGGLAVLVAVIALAAPLSLPFSDGINFYYLKAKAFFLEGSFVPFQLRAHELPWTAPGHPPLVPLTVTWLYLFTGRVAEHASLLLWPAWYASLLGAFHAFARHRVSARVAAWCTLGFGLAGSGLTVAAMRGSYSDLPLAVALLAACGLLATWLASPGAGWRPPAAAGLFLAAAALTKEEGLALAGVVVCALAAVLLRRRDRLRAGQSAALVAFLAAASLPLWWLRLGYPHPELTVSGHLRLAALPWTAGVTLVGLTARACLRWFAVLAVAGAAVAWARPGWRRLLGRLDAGFWFLVLAIGGALALYWAAMIADPLDTVAELSRTSGRLLDQVLPLPFLAGVWLAAAAARLPLVTAPVVRVRRTPEISPVP